MNKKSNLFSPAVEVHEKPKKVAESRLYSPAAELEEETPSSEHIDTALDASYGAAQGATYNFADELYGAGRAALEQGGGNRDPELYSKYRDEARDQWAVARKRSPIATTVGEVSGAVVSPVNKVFGPIRGLRGVGRGLVEGAAQAYGATDEENLKDQAVDAGKGAAVGAATGLLFNTLTKGYSKSPTASRAEVLGVKGRDYLVDGPGDRKKIIQRITDSGMLKNRKMDYDPINMKFKPQGKSKFALDELEANTEDRLLGRATDAVEKLQSEKDKHFGPILDSRYVPSGEIDQMVQEISDEYVKRGLIKGPADRTAAVNKIRDNIYDQVMNMGGNMSSFSLRELDTLKRMAQEDVKNFSKGLGELGDTDELARITARKLKEMVETKIGSNAFKKINSAQHDFLSVSGDLRNKIRNLDLAPPARPHLEKTNAVEGVLDNMMGGSQSRLDRADVKDWWQKYIPSPARAVIPYAAEEVPGTLYRQNFEGQNTIKGNWRDPSSEPNIPEQLIRTPLPRTTQGLMEKKPFVLAKVAQMMPDMYESVKDVFEHNPENLGDLAQVLAQKMPHVFEKDKYNRFDGRIVSEADKQKAIKDTLNRKDIDSIEQGHIITKLNQEGLFDAN